MSSEAITKNDLAAILEQLLPSKIASTMPFVVLTYAEYSTLSDAEKNNGKLYFVTDLQAIYYMSVRYVGEVWG